MTKTQQVQAFLRGGDIRSALRIAAKFHRQFSKEEQRIIQIAHECLTGKAAFYRQLGIDTECMVSQAADTLQNVYSCNLKKSLRENIRSNFEKNN